MTTTFNRHSLSAFIAGFVLIAYGVVFLGAGVGQYLI